MNIRKQYEEETGLEAVEHITDGEYSVPDIKIFSSGYVEWLEEQVIKARKEKKPNMKNKFALFMSNQMIKKELTLREVSRRSGIDVRKISRIERGKAYPPEGELLEKLIIALELNDKQKDEMINLAKTANSKTINEVDYVLEDLFNPVYMTSEGLWYKLNNADQ